MCARCGCVLLGRFIDEVMAELGSGANGVRTMKQFGNLKFDDIDWPTGPSNGKKVFVRMAIRQFKSENGA